MKPIKTIFIFSCICAMKVYTSSYSRVELRLEIWTEMSSINRAYEQSLEDFKQGKAVNFVKIFDNMSRLAEKLSIEDGARKNYLALISDRERQVTLLQASKNS